MDLLVKAGFQQHFLCKSEIFFHLCESAGTDFWLFAEMQDGLFENVLAESLAHISFLQFRCVCCVKFL